MSSKKRKPLIQDTAIENKVPPRQRKPSAKQADMDDSEKEKLLEKLQRQVKQLTKQTRSQKKTLDNSREKEKQYEQRKARLEEDYEDTFGHPVPESEDGDDYELENNKLAGNSDEELESAGFGTPHFRSSVRTVATITQSPSRPVPRKSCAKTPTAKMASHGTNVPGPLSTPSRAQSQVEATVAACPKPAQADGVETAIAACPKSAQADSTPRANQHGDDNEPGTQPPEVRLNTDGKALGHYYGITKKILGSSLHGYESLIIHGNMFPSSDIQIGWADKIWEMYCGKYIPEDERPIQLTEEMSMMMFRRGTRVRAASRTRIEPLIQPLFKFKSGIGRNTLKYNKELYLTLSTDFGWYYENPVARTRYMQHPIILQSICVALFYGAHAYGNHKHLSFDPIPVEAIAFLFTLIEHCLTQWKDGYYTYTKLDENISEPVYMRHLTRIGEWINLDKAVTETIRHRWFVLANQKLGTSVSAETETKMSNKDRVQAIAELEEFGFDNLDAEQEDGEVGGSSDKGNISDDLNGGDHTESEGEKDVVDRSASTGGDRTENEGEIDASNGSAGTGGASKKRGPPVSASVVKPKRQKQ